MSDLILAIDPGKTTGLAYDGRAWQIGNSHLGLWWELERHQPSIIVFERFVHTQRSGIDYTPVEMIGVIKLYVARMHVTLVAQTPSEAKNFFTNDKLKKLGLYQTKMPHAMDALRHLLYYQMKIGKFDFQLLK